MNYKMIGRILAQILLVEAVLMAPSVIWCIIDREPQIIRAFAASIALTLAAAGVLWLACRKAQRILRAGRVRVRRRQLDRAQPDGVPAVLPVAGNPPV